MKKHLVIVIMLIFILFPLSAQKAKDVLYLKNGSMIYGKLIEIFEDQYRIQTSDGSIFIYKSSEVEKFAKEYPFFDGRKAEGFGFALEAGFLVGAQNTDYFAPFSFSFLAGITSKTKNIISLGSGVEFIGRPYTPLFIEYKHLFYDRKTTPFIFVRGGALLHIGEDEAESYDYYNDNEPTNYKGGGSFAFGSGISWAKEDYETYLSFGYRYAHTSYDRKEYNRGNITYKNSLNRLEIKFGFKF
jgi:hypothetical protein